MKHYLAALLALCFLVSACAGRKDDNAVSREGTEDAVESIAVDDQKSEETKDEDKPIAIGGYTIRQTASDRRIYIIISDNHSASLSGIEQIPIITDLSLSMNKDAREVDLEPLSRLPLLGYVNLGGWGVTVIPDFSSSSNLTILKLDRSSLTSLEGIERISSLESLTIDRNRVPLSDISALSYLQNLKRLNVVYSVIGIDFSVLKDLPILEELTIIDAGIENLTGISQLSQVKNLRLEYSSSEETVDRGRFKNIEEVGRMGLLVELHINDALRSLEFLSNLTNLESLTLIAADSRKDYRFVLLPLDASPIKNLTNLKRLIIRGFDLQNAEVFKQLPNLKYLDTDLIESE
jgi:Leucine-rich repeat (LRR) protein